MIEKGRYRRKVDSRTIWVIEDLGEKVKIRRPKGAFMQVVTITSRGFLARHEKVSDDGRD